MLKIRVLTVAAILFLTAAQAQKMHPGNWQGKLELNDSTSLTFAFEITYALGNEHMSILNGVEKIDVPDLYFSEETPGSLLIKMPLFDSEFRCQNFKDSLRGLWVNHNRKEKNILPFSAFFVSDKNTLTQTTETSKTKKYQVAFEPGTKDEYAAVGIFNTRENSTWMEGTFLTETGDYRYLSGTNVNGKIAIGCFDGSHAFLFTGQENVTKGTIKGCFYSGAHSFETWTAKANEKAKLRDPESLTYLKKGFSGFDFSLSDLDGKMISLKDSVYKNKVVVLQIMGSWCPNCMDETGYFAGLYPKYKSKGLEIISVSFEKGDVESPEGLARARKNVTRTKTRFNASYTFLLAALPASLDNVSKTFPMLSNVMSFPTTIYIDKKGRVRKIYTGFSGPATGSYYQAWQEKTEKFLDKLLNEE